jgi:hypothetical protein
MNNPELIAQEVSQAINDLREKYGCELGIWLNWRDLIHNFELLKANPNLNELHFGIQIRIPNGSNNEIQKHTNVKS